MGGEADRERNLRGLISATGFIKREVGKRIRLRYVPEITFQFDPSLEYADHINRLIRELHQNEEVHEGE
jgi:ribosome-binding factor A